MTRFIALALLAAASYLLPPLAMAQAHSGPTVTCESRDGTYRECWSGFQRRTVLVQNLSQARCVEGRTWGTHGPSMIWVDQGCRGVFGQARDAGGPGWGGPGGGGQVVRCESLNGGFNECRLPMWGDVHLANQLSSTRCVRDRNWGVNRDTIWVNNGCRGDFIVTGFGAAPTPPIQGPGGGWTFSIECGRPGRASMTCPWDWRRGFPILIERLSTAPCIQGQSWGTNGNGPHEIWVSQGCRARFGSR